MSKITKAIIPAAGLGTRFLPETKALPKEMLPIVDTPTIQYIVSEAKQSGIKDVLIVIGKGKWSIENHFDANPELEANLAKRGKNDLLRLICKTNDMNIYFTRQSHPNGLGDAIYTARSFVGNEPFAVLLGDDVTRDTPPLTKQLIDSFAKTGVATLAVKRVPRQDVSKYGIIDPAKQVTQGLYNVKRFVEKPDPQTAPSNLAIIGRYVLTPQIFTALSETQPDSSGEIQLTTAIDILNQTQRVFAHEFKGERYDTGNKLSWLETNIKFGLRNPEIADNLKKISQRNRFDYEFHKISTFKKHQAIKKFRFSYFLCYIKRLYPISVIAYCCSDPLHVVKSVDSHLIKLQAIYRRSIMPNIFIYLLLSTLIFNHRISFSVSGFYYHSFLKKQDHPLT